MLARQSMGNDLVNFDSSSILQWSAFLAQYRISTKMCGFSSTKNILRLNRGLSGEARRKIKMLLVTAKDPEVILNILDQFDGKPDAIVHEIIKTAQKIRKSLGFKKLWRIQLFCEKYLIGKRLSLHVVTQRRICLTDKNINARSASLNNFSDWTEKMADIFSKVIASTTNFQATTSEESISTNLKKKKDKGRKFSDSRSCKICNDGSHSLESYSAFKRADIKQRWKMTEKAKVCFFFCLLKHQDKYHHTMLHKKNTLHADN